MATLDVGRICIKTAGREAGRYCAVLKKIDNQFVLITGPKVLTGVKRRRCNIEHLEPTPFSIKIKEEATAKEIIKAYDEAGLIKKFNLRKPSPEVIKEVEKKVPVKKIEVPKKKVVKKPEVKKVEKPKEKKPEKKKGITLKLKIPTLRKPKKPEVKKPEKKVKKKPKKIVKKKVSKKKKKK